MEHNKPREVGLREARTELADLVTEAAVRGTITYLTNRGRRVAAVVPVPVAEAGEAAEHRWAVEVLTTDPPKYQERCRCGAVRQIHQDTSCGGPR